MGWQWRCHVEWSTFCAPAFLHVWSSLRAERLQSAALSGSLSQNEGQCWQRGACWPLAHGSYSWQSPAEQSREKGDIHNETNIYKRISKIVIMWTYCTLVIIILNKLIMNCLFTCVNDLIKPKNKDLGFFHPHILFFQNSFFFYIM